MAGSFSSLLTQTSALSIVAVAPRWCPRQTFCTLLLYTRNER